MANAESKLWHLQHINIFRDLTEEEILEIDERSKMKSFDKKVHIYFPNDPASVIYLLKSGRVKIVSFGTDDKEIIKTIVYPGEIFGELAITNEGQKRQDYAIAMDKEVKLCTMNREEMLEVLEGNARLRGSLTKVIGDRMMQLERRFESMIFFSAEERITLFLKNLAKKIGTPIGDEILLKHGLTHEEIGQLTGTSRQFVTTILNKMKSEDKIYMERNKILIRDIDGL